MATIITKNSSTASSVPAAGSLQQGELAVNVTDKKLYTKDSSAAVVKLVGSLGNQEANAVAITGGTINGTAIGGTTPAAAAFTTASASGGFTGNLAGNASTVTNGVYTTGSYADPAWITSLAGSKITGNISGNAANVTGTVAIANGGTGLTALGTGVQTALGQTVTGSGGIVLAASPSLTTPNLGTPSAVTLTNATGLPVSTGISGLGTNVATALGVSVGSVGSVVVNGGALGTPSSGTLTNATGLPLSTGVTGTLAVANGGTGITSFGTGVATALGVNVGSAGAFVVNGGALGTPSSGTLTNATGLPLSTGVTGTLATTNGGTGLTSFTANGVVYASSTSALTTGSALTFNGTTLTLPSGNISIGSSTAGTTLDVFNGDAVNAQRLRLTTSGTDGVIQVTRSSGTVPNLIFRQDASELMRLTSTGLGIGTSSPSQKLQVVGVIASTGPASALTASSTFLDYNTTLNLGRFAAVGNTTGTAAPIYFSQYSSNGSVGRDAAIIDSSGNLGLGVTPSAWRSTTRALQVGTGTSLQNFDNTGVVATSLGSNLYFNSSDQAIYLQSYAASSYALVGGEHRWNIAPSGTAGTIATFTQAMTLDASGNLVLGTTGASSARLYVRGSGTTSATASFEASNSSGATRLYVQDDGTTRFFGSAGSETARITSGGNFGIGTSSPSQKLEVSGGAAQFNGGGIDSTLGDAILFGNTSFPSVQKNRIRSSISAAATSNILSFETSTATAGTYNTNQLVLRGNGNVGIGTIDPTVPLEVAQSASTYTELRLANTTTGNNGGQVTFAGAASVNMGWIRCIYDGVMTFGTYNGSSVTERGRFTAGGYFKASNNGTYNGSTSSYHELYSNASSDWIGYFTQATATSPNGVVIQYTAAAPNNTSSPFLQCQDTGGIRANIRSNGGIANYQGNDVNLSDRREKTNFAPAKSYLDTICAIPVQTFNYIDQSENDPGLTLGVVAQDVQAVAPELVTESDWSAEKDGSKMRLSIYQTDLQYALMKCIQELKAQNDDLRARVAQLEAK